ncbi:MAG: hypothetical protein QW279_04015 [Candidatus Jordarchaeaceae archaeon]
MNSRSSKMLLVGDNPFHGISHLSQDRAFARGNILTYPKHAANLVAIALENGADGFMFSVNEATLSILREVCKRLKNDDFSLYAIVPYAFEYVRLATQVGGIPGLAKKITMQLLTSGNVGTFAKGLKGVIYADPTSLMKTYMIYEISRIKSIVSKDVNLGSVLLHQVVTDMALALNLDWLFKSYVDFMLKLGIIPGFNTGNFVYLVNKFRDWDIDMSKISIAAPFNKVGFQMIPSKRECEKVLESVPESNIIAISILAAGYLKPLEAIEYIATLANIKGVAVGVSKESHARETFKILKQKL